jgi:preprotein translocase subunit SecF
MGRFAQFGNDMHSGKRSIDFVGRRRLWYLIAVVLMVISVLALLTRGLNPGIEFRGGSEFRVSSVADPSEITGQNAVTSVRPGSQVKVSVLNGDSVRVQTEQLTPEETEEVSEALSRAYKIPEANITSSFVGPSWGADVSGKAVQGLVVFLILVALVIALYFRTWKMAVAAIVALVHDLLITVGVYALVGFEVTPESVIGFLTILGYSLYDTVVVFDKVRENTDHITSSTKRTYAEAANLAVNQTLVRSINTSVVALLPIGSILFIGAFLLGAGTLKDLSLALFVGVAAGTYSSIFIATPLLVQLRENEPELKAQAGRVLRRRADKTAVAARDEAATRVPVGAATAAASPGTGRSPEPSGPSLRPASGQRQQPRRTSGKARPGGRKG